MFKYQAIDTHLAHYIISSNSSCELPVFLHRVEILNLYNPPPPKKNSISGTCTCIKNLGQLQTATAYANTVVFLYLCIPINIRERDKPYK